VVPLGFSACGESGTLGFRRILSWPGKDKRRGLLLGEPVSPVRVAGSDGSVAAGACGDDDGVSDSASLALETGAAPDASGGLCEGLCGGLADEELCAALGSPTEGVGIDASAGLSPPGPGTV
jgi:hypothetical protein